MHTSWEDLDQPNEPNLPDSLLVDRASININMRKHLYVHAWNFSKTRRTMQVVVVSPAKTPRKGQPSSNQYAPTPPWTHDALRCCPNPRGTCTRDRTCTCPCARQPRCQASDDKDQVRQVPGVDSAHMIAQAAVLARLRPPPTIAPAPPSSSSACASCASLARLLRRLPPAPPAPASTLACM